MMAELSAADFLDLYTITNQYGAAPGEGISYEEGRHTGVDFSLDGQNVVALTPSVVVKTGQDPDRWGNYVVTRDAKGIYNIYAHLKNFAGELGRWVSGGSNGRGLALQTGDMIGAEGATGQATGPHLHFEARTDWTDSATSIDPLAYLTGQEGQTPREMQQTTQKTEGYDPEKNYHIPDEIVWFTIPWIWSDIKVTPKKAMVTTALIIGFFAVKSLTKGA